MVQILDEYLDFTKGTEPPVQFHRWSFLSCVGAALRRNVYVPFGHDYIYPNMFVFIVGVPGTRKSTSINITKKLLEKAGFEEFAFTKTTKEKFLLDFETGFTSDMEENGILDVLNRPVLTPEDKPRVQNVFINCSEFVDFIGQNNVNFINLLTTLWDNMPSYQERLKNSKSVNIPNPTVSLVGGITPTSISTALPPEVIGQGFMSRLVLVYCNPTGTKITWPKPPDPKAMQHFIEFFRRMGTIQGEGHFTQEAKDLIDSIYQTWPNLDDVRLQYYGSRRLVHLLKLCIILAACDTPSNGTPVIKIPHVEEANTILTWTERKMSTALGEFGESRNAKASQKIMEALAIHSGPILAPDLWKVVSMDLERRQQLSELLSNLKAAGKITVIEGDGGAYISIANGERESKRVGVNYEKYIREFGQKDLETKLELIDVEDHKTEGDSNGKPTQGESAGKSKIPFDAL